jgi:hypothetical protein
VRSLERSFDYSIGRAEELERRLNLHLESARLESAIIDVMELAWKTNKTCSCFIYESFKNFFTEATERIVKWTKESRIKRLRPSAAADSLKDEASPRHMLTQGVQPYVVLRSILDSANTEKRIPEFCRLLSSHFRLEEDDLYVLVQFARVINYTPVSAVTARARKVATEQSKMPRFTSVPHIPTLRSILFGRNGVVECPVVWRVAQALVAHALWQNGKTFNLEEEYQENQEASEALRDAESGEYEDDAANGRPLSPLSPLDPLRESRSANLL